jgi:hypothetical protein
MTPDPHDDLRSEFVVAWLIVALVFALGFSAGVVWC